MEVSTALNALKTPLKQLLFIFNEHHEKKTIAKVSWNSITYPKPEYTEMYSNSSENFPNFIEIW